MIGKIWIKRKGGGRKEGKEGVRSKRDGERERGKG